MPPIDARTFVVAAIMLVVCACSRNPTATSRTAPATTQASQEERPRYDDSRLSADERRAVRAATEAVVDPNRPRRDFDQEFRYSVFRSENGDWIVTVWRIHRFQDGRPQFVPGGFTDVTLDSNFKVKFKMPGA